MYISFLLVGSWRKMSRTWKCLEHFIMMANKFISFTVLYLCQPLCSSMMFQFKLFYTWLITYISKHLKYKWMTFIFYVIHVLVDYLFHHHKGSYLCLVHLSSMFRGSFGWIIISWTYIFFCFTDCSSTDREKIHSQIYVV